MLLGHYTKLLRQALEIRSKPRFDFPRASKDIKTYTDDPSLSLTGFTAGWHTTVFLCDVSGLFGADHPENKAEI